VRNPRTIIFDVDDVLLDFISGFRDYVNNNYGYNIVGEPDKYSMDGWLPYAKDNKDRLITNFNKSWEFGCLSPLQDAQFVVKHFCLQNRKLPNPYRLVALTKCGSGETTTALRKANLHNVFGSVFDDVFTLEYTDSKADFVKDFKRSNDVCLTIDDDIKNCADMAFLGIFTVILNSSTNNGVNVHNTLPRAGNWLDLNHKHLLPLLMAG
jgi:FMN phosphatase YigB (HAD superfamily)